MQTSMFQDKDCSSLCFCLGLADKERHICLAALTGTRWLPLRDYELDTSQSKQALEERPGLRGSAATTVCMRPITAAPRGGLITKHSIEVLGPKDELPSPPTAAYECVPFSPPQRPLVDFHWPPIHDMLGRHVEIIRLHSDEDQAGLFAGILSTLSLPYKHRARHAGREAAAARGPDKLQRCLHQADHVHGSEEREWRSSGFDRSPHSP
ncbi:hypothetical protein EYF80_041267 [Liparis tanakae]|uniref:Uncharacterized protein n=1 Tax=Liparis tanakae TaxID=230148 RepID=A0A4Z2G6J5_9TELE|nr:hypothetical protein EYF80_041267 [Liparis tanakae]